ncbi:MAG: PAS domain S-box protein, partial [Desulfobulbaceae bacterium]|nr:PAS domain S-box protein [Desulfobulbaceae bacterium]
GIDPYRDFKDLSFGGTHDTVVYAVRDGKVDAGTVRTDTLERMAIEGKINLGDFYAIYEHGGEVVHLPFVHSTRSYPEWPFAKVKHTPDELAEKVATVLLEMPWDCAATRAARCAGWTIPLNYQPVHDCLKELKVGPYKDLGKITPADVFRKYWGWFLAAAILFLLVAGSSIFILKLNRGIKKSHTELQQEVEERKQVEAVLRESEERFRDISFSMADWIWEVDRDGKYTFASESVKEILGYAPKELIGKTPFELMAEDGEKGIGEAFKIIASEKKPIVDLEHWNLTKEGKGVCLLTNGVPILNDKGELCGYRGVDKDITEKKKAQDTLKESEEKYRTLVESSTDAILMMDKERNIVSCNQAFLNLFGYSDAEIVSKSIRIIHTSDDTFDSFGETAYPIINEHGYFRTEWEFMRKDGTVVPVETVTSPVRSADGTIEGYIAMIRDFTEREQAEEERIRLATAIEQVSESVVITDRDGTTQYVNPAFESITGYGRQEAVGQNPRILKSGKHSKEFYADLWNTIASGKVWRGHFINKNKNGTLYEEEATISPIKNTSGEIINFVAVKRDVTEEIKLEDKLRQAQKMEAIGTLAGGIAHDFNNILSAIIGYTELAEYEIPEGSKTREKLKEVLKAGRRAKDLVKQILAFSRQGDQELKPLQISHIVKEALKLLRASLPTTIEFRRNIEPDTGIIEADPTQIHQVLMNLCTNAAHAMNNKGGVLEVGIRNV